MSKKLRVVALVLAAVLCVGLAGCGVTDAVENAASTIDGDSSTSGEGNFYDDYDEEDMQYLKHNVYVDMLNLINSDFMMVVGYYGSVYGYEEEIDLSAPEAIYYLEPDNWEYLEWSLELADMEPAMAMDGTVKKFAPDMLALCDLLDEMYEFYIPLYDDPNHEIDAAKAQAYHEKMVADMDDLWPMLTDFMDEMTEMVRQNRLQTIEETKEDGFLGRYHLLSIIQYGKDLSDYLYYLDEDDYTQMFKLADEAKVKEFTSILYEHIDGLKEAGESNTLKVLEADLMDNEYFPLIIETADDLRICLEKLEGHVANKADYPADEDYYMEGAMGDLDYIIDTIVDHYNASIGY